MKKSLKVKLIMSIILIILGIVIFIVAIFLDKSMNQHLRDYLSGFSGGIMGVGIVVLLRSINRINNPEKNKKMENQENDERLRSINCQAMSLTFRVTMFIEVICSITFAILGKFQIPIYISYIVITQLIIYLISYFVISKRT